MEENKKALSDEELDEVAGGICMDAPIAARTAELRMPVSGKGKTPGGKRKGGFKTANGVGIQSSITKHDDGHSDGPIMV